MSASLAESSPVTTPRVQAWKTGAGTPPRSSGQGRDGEPGGPALKLPPGTGRRSFQVKMAEAGWLYSSSLCW
jgi:hypothetical protein